MQKRVLFVAMGTFFVGVFFSFLAALSLHRTEKLAIRHEIQKDVENTALSLSRELTVGIEILYALRNQLASVKKMNESTFMQFAEKSMGRHQNIRAMEWAERVESAQRKGYENAVSADVKDFKINEKNEKEERVAVEDRQRYFPVRYITPYQSNENLIGFDLASNKEIFRALKMSWYQALPIATPDHRQKTSSKNSPFYIMLLPVFEGEPKTSAQRKEVLRGFLLVRFAVEDIFELATNSTVKESINLELLDKDFNQNQKVIYSHYVDLSTLYIDDLTYNTEPIFFSGREWLLRGTPSADYVKSRLSIAPKMIFFVGVFIFGLLAYIIYSLQHRALNIQQRVDAKTSQLRQANRKLEKMSKSDGLTGYNNRDYFEESTDAELKRAQRDKLPISMLLIDFDNIKQYNEQNGRVAGDRIIRLIGHAIADVLKRPGDLLARYEGGTFSVLLPNTQDGAPIASLCIDAIEHLKIPFDAKGKCITVSIGGVTVIDSHEMSGSKLLTYAEIALGKAIAMGRNQFFWIYYPEANQPQKEAEEKVSG